MIPGISAVGRNKAPLRLFFLILAVLLAACTPAGPTPPAVPATPPPEPSEPLRLFLIRSYGVDDVWGQQIRTGLLETLSRSGYDRVAGSLVLTEFVLNAERYRGTEVDNAVVSAVLNSIEASMADAVVVVDDPAARSIIPNYSGPDLPFVYCGLNGEPGTYGLTGENVTGVLERPYPIQTIRMAQDLGDEIHEVLIVSDTSLSGRASVTKISEVLSADETLPARVTTGMTSEWEGWQRLVQEEFAQVDAVLMGQHAGLVAEDGETVPEDEVLAYTLENSPVPVFGLWLGDVQQGAVGGLTVAPYEQGRAAAHLVVRIVEGTAPSELPPVTPDRNVLAVNVAAVERWSLKVPLELLVSARVLRGFPAP